MAIRRARQEDLPGIEEVFRSHGPASGWEHASTYYAGFFASPELHGGDRVVVRVSQGRVVGVTGLGADWYESTDVFWLGWLCALNDDRRMEHAAALVDWARRKAARLGARKLYIEASARAPDEPPHSDYWRLGFRAEARLRDYHAEGIDRVIYGLDLSRRQ